MCTFILKSHNKKGLKTLILGACYLERGKKLGKEDWRMENCALSVPGSTMLPLCFKNESNIVAYKGISTLGPIVGRM